MSVACIIVGSSVVVGAVRIAGDGAEHCREAPADREHPAHAHADEAARVGVQRGRAQRQPDLRELEERPERERP